MHIARVVEKLRRRRGAIPTASTADIAFLVLVFFMATSIFSRDKGLKLVLPEPGETSLPARNLVQVLVNARGELLLDNEPVTLPGLRDAVAGRLAANDSLVVTLKVSRDADYGRMIEVFDELRMAGVSRLSLVTARAGIEPPDRR